MEERPYTILAIDDDIKLLAMLKKMLKDDYEVVTCHEPLEVEEVLSRIHVDLVLLDIVMAGRNGYEVCRRLRKLRPKSELPIVFVTSNDRLNDLAKGFEMDANDYILKPVRMDVLKRSISSNLFEHFVRGSRQPESEDDLQKEIIVVGDRDTSIQTVTENFLDHEFNAVSFTDAREALRHMGVNKETVAAVIIQVDMDVFSGYELYTQMVRLKQGLPVVFYSLDAPENRYPELYETMKALPHLRDPDELGKIVDALCDQPNAVRTLKIASA